MPSKTREQPSRITPDSAARRAADAGIECINCGVCYAACDTVRWNSDYLGPAALNRAWTLVNDVRDAGNAARLAAVAAAGGCHACHSHQSCQEHCPQALNPTARSPGLKRRTLGLSQGRDQAVNVRLYLWQRLTAALMVPLVLVHLALIFYATRQGLADILSRTRGSIVWAALYGAFVSPRPFTPRSAATVLAEWSPLGAGARDLAAVAFGLLLLVLGLRRWRRWCCMMRPAHRTNVLGWALVHRLSGLALAIFLPLHFLTRLAIDGEARLESFLRWSDQPDGEAPGDRPRLLAGGPHVGRCGCWCSRTSIGATGRSGWPCWRRRYRQSSPSSCLRMF